MVKTYDYAVIGAGIAGASVGAELARRGSVLMLEMESRPGYHTTGRSAAILAPGYGPKPIRSLTRASVDFFRHPPTGFCDSPLLSQIDVVMVARSDQMLILQDAIAELSRETTVEQLNDVEMKNLHPLLRDGYAKAGMVDRSGSEIDVHTLHQGYLKLFRELGGTVLTDAQVQSLTHVKNGWQIDTTDATWHANIIVNAAGAWAEQIGSLAGAEEIGLVPKRRTALIVDAPDGFDVKGLPLLVDIEEQFYMKPDAGRLLISPANEDPMPACDVQPDEMDIAYCIDRIENAFDIKVRKIGTKWAGLRSFVRDKSPVAGFSAKVPGFFWLAGQGGYGIQSAPALSRFAAALILGDDIPQDILAEGLDPASLSPDRLGTAA
jgi:D-arginine dehydrogenase